MRNSNYINAFIDTKNMQNFNRYTESQREIINSLPQYEDELRKKPSINEAKQILDSSHFGMTGVKRAVLEYAAARMRNPKIGKVLCLEGPPGVGKTTIVASIAKCLGLPLQKINMGSLVAGWELVGSNPTWSDSSIGMITQSIIRAGTFNFVMLLDEIDKTVHQTTSHVTPESTLLQIFDDNKRNFEDLYLGGLTLDLSGILFVATCNNSELISPILLDRMDLIHVPSYSEKEKHTILTEYILPELHLKYRIYHNEFKLDATAISAIIRFGEGEDGIRTIRKCAESIFLRVSYELESKKSRRIVYMGHDVYETICLNHAGSKEYILMSGVGVVNTFVGRKDTLEYISIEIAISEGSGNWVTTGVYPSERDTQYMEPQKRNIQDIDTAITALVHVGCLSKDYFMYKDVHIHFNHVKDNTTVKGIALPIAVALYSAVSNSALPSNSLVFGDLSILGRLLPLKRWPLYLEHARRVQAKRVFMPTSINMSLDGFPITQSDRLNNLLELANLVENNMQNRNRQIGFIRHEQAAVTHPVMM